MLSGEFKKRSFSIAGHRTSVALEPEFWNALQAQARDERLPLAALVARVDEARGERNLASALRVHVLMRALGKAAPSF
jgi:predicted DNA-binding ribbon-helix-helix protein